jgi:hypothetical protein
MHPQLINMKQYKSISNGAQYVTLDSKIKCLSLGVFVFLETPSITVKLGLHIRKGVHIANHMPNHYDQPIKNTSLIQVQLITVVVGGPQLCCAFYQPPQARRIWCEKTISKAKLAHFAFFTINFLICSHIMSTVGDALSTPVYNTYPIL